MKVSRLLLLASFIFTMLPLSVQAASYTPEITNISFTDEGNGQYRLSATLNNPDWNSTPNFYPYIEYRGGSDDATKKTTLSLAQALLLTPRQALHFETTLQLPLFLTGNAEVHFGLRDALGQIVVEKVVGNISGAQTPFAVNLGCHYGDYPAYSGISNFIAMTGKETLKFTCLVGNGTDVGHSLRIHLNAYEYGALGKKVAETDYPIITPAGKSQLLAMELPAELQDTPGNHTLEFTVINEKGVILTRPLLVKFDITGPAATITHLRLGETGYGAGSMATVEYRGSVRPASWDKDTAYSIELSMANKDGQKCTNEPKKFPYVSSNEVQTVKLPVDVSCAEPTLTLSLLDGQGTPILSQSVSVQQSIGGNTSVMMKDRTWLWVAIAAVIGALILGLTGFIWWKKRSQNTPPPVFPATM